MEKRLKTHPILDCATGKTVNFTYGGQKMAARENEVISSALFASGIRSFGKHHVDGSHQGIFCANGQCGQCMILADKVPVKACITPIRDGMLVEPLNGLPELPADDKPLPPSQVAEVETDVLIVGGGPSGLTAAEELGAKGASVIICDDKMELGGKLSLQTHNFFGSTKECYAGTRGFEIGVMLTKNVEKLKSVQIWLNSPVVGVFSDSKVGIVKDGIYTLVKPKKILITTGAREKVLAFPGCDLPGVYGAGAFQTLVNRDRVQCAERVLIVGGGNVGLIVAYHALQAGMDVAAIVEALPQCGGYKVHLDKIKRLGVPVFTRHTVLRAEGKDKLETAIICAVDDKFKPIAGTEKCYDVDTMLIAVGLSSVNELAVKAREYGIPTYTAGDAEEIAEASAAMFTGRITGRRILKEMGYNIDIPVEWEELSKILRAKPGMTKAYEPPQIKTNGVTPLIRCVQEIPCNPCTDACLKGYVKLDGANIMALPKYQGTCAGCSRCVAICPGLAVVLVDTRKCPEGKAKVIIPWEMPEGLIQEGSIVTTTSLEGEVVGKGKVVTIKPSPMKNKRSMVHLEVPIDDAAQVAGIRIREPKEGYKPKEVKPVKDEDIIICRCERVTKKEIMDYIKQTGCTDVNALKGALRVGLGPCGSKTCNELVMRIFRELGMDPKNLTPGTQRPFTQEVPIGAFVRGDGK